MDNHMHDIEHILERLKESAEPSQALRSAVKTRVMRRVRADLLRDLRNEAVLTADMQRSIKRRLLSGIALPPVSSLLPKLKDALRLSEVDAAHIRMMILGRLAPLKPSPAFGSVLKWTAALSAFVLLVRLLPFVFIAHVTQAESRVEVIPTSGAVSLTIAGISMPLYEAQTLKGPALVQTGDGEATILFHDDAVVRLAPHTSVRVHDLTDRPDPTNGPTVSLVRGTAWTVAFLAPTVAPFIVETPDGTALDLHEGSASLTVNGAASFAIYDKRATVNRGKDMEFLVSGESATTNGTQLLIAPLDPALFVADWATTNLARDGAHRAEIAQRQQERRAEMAGILPTSILYPAKRIAEEMDVLLTLGSEARVQKRIQQAETRLNEALTLASEGDEEEANVQIAAYRDSLLALASGTGDNLVKFLIRKQITEASADVAAVTPEDDSYVIKEAVYDVVASVPDAPLKSQDIEGYVLLDKLAAANRLLANTGSSAQGAAALAELKPYLGDVLGAESTVHPLLKKEALSLVVTANDALGQIEESPEAEALMEELQVYVPAQEQEYELVRTSEEELQAIVAGIIDRIFTYSMSRSRYNQLYLEMQALHDHPDRGAILRRLSHALPENGLAVHVRNEIRKLGNEISY